MKKEKNINPPKGFGYQPNREQHGYQPKKKINEGYQPNTTKSKMTQPPNVGSNIQVPKDNKNKK